jgi:hypothetical protein
MPRITVNADTGFPVYGVFARAADQAQAYENTSGSTPFEFFRLFSGDISTGGQRDDYSINVPSEGKIYVHVVSCLPDELEPVIYVNGDVQSDSIPLPGAASFNFNLIGGGGGLTFGVSGNDGSTGEYIISAEFYPV